MAMLYEKSIVKGDSPFLAVKKISMVVLLAQSIVKQDSTHSEVLEHGYPSYKENTVKGDSPHASSHEY